MVARRESVEGRVSAIASLAAELRPVVSSMWSQNTGILRAWLDVAGNRAQLADEIGGSPLEAWQEIEWMSAEKTTHYAWCIFGRPDRAVSIWIHQYKPDGIRSTGHAHTVHNHRFDFATAVLNGGYSYTKFAIGAGGPTPRPTSTAALRSGEAMTIYHEEIHRIDSVEPGTCTLLVKSAPRLQESTSWDLITGTSSTHTPHGSDA